MSRRRAFTVTELLIVIGIIALLIAILLPTLSSARDHAASVQCMSRLRELYLAQTQYAGENRGRYAGIVATADERWERRLAKYLRRHALPEKSDLLTCPSAPPSDHNILKSSYGLNSCIMMSNWRMRRDARMDSSRIILMGDKPLQLDDYLTTDEGWILMQPEATGGAWYRSVGHSSRSQLRHARNRTANMVMADGHVESFHPRQLQRDAGHWYWGGEGYDEYVIDMGACCP
jgi:prepilin-type processing-associated H-X9-DG protein